MIRAGRYYLLATYRDILKVLYRDIWLFTIAMLISCYACMPLSLTNHLLGTSKVVNSITLPQSSVTGMTVVS